MLYEVSWVKRFNTKQKILLALLLEQSYYSHDLKILGLTYFCITIDGASLTKQIRLL